MDEINEGDIVNYIRELESDIGTVYFAQPKHNKYFVNFRGGSCQMCGREEIERIPELEIKFMDVLGDL